MVSNAQATVVTSTAYVSGAAAAALVIGTAVIAEASGPQPQPVPEMAPERAVALQDCTQPVDFSSGNLRCR